MRLFTIFIVCFLALLALSLVCAQTTTVKPGCEARRCTKRDKRVCATNGKRQCRLFKNHCELRSFNCKSIQKWNPTGKKRCRNNKVGAGPKRC